MKIPIFQQRKYLKRKNKSLDEYRTFNLLFGLKYLFLTQEFLSIIHFLFSLSLFLLPNAAVLSLRIWGALAVLVTSLGGRTSLALP